jgi:hypothetical protein
MKRFFNGPDTAASCYPFSLCLSVLPSPAALRTLVVIGVQLCGCPGEDVCGT